MNKAKIISQVINDLKDIIPYNNDIKFEDYDSDTCIGKYLPDQNKIVVCSKIRNEHQFKCVIAYLLVDSCGMCDDKNLKNEFDNLHLDYDIDKTPQKIHKRLLNKQRTGKYVIWCDSCDKIWYHKRTEADTMTDFKCPICGCRAIIRKPSSRRGKRLIRLGGLD